MWGGIDSRSSNSLPSSGGEEGKGEGGRVVFFLGPARWLVSWNSSSWRGDLPLPGWVGWMDGGFGGVALRCVAFLRSAL